MWVPSTCNLTKDLFFFFAPPLRSCKQQLLFSHNSVGQDFRQSCFGWFHKALVGGTQKVTISWWLGLKHLRWLYYMSGALEWMKNWDRFLFLSFCLSLYLSLHVFLFVCFLFLFSCVASLGFFTCLLIPYTQQIWQCMKCLWQKRIWYWDLSMPTVGGSQFKNLRFWRKVIFCTYLFSFEKQLLVSY